MERKMKVSKNGKAVLWVRKGAMVVGPGTYETRKELKKEGGKWSPNAKGWTFRYDYEKAGMALEKIAGLKGWDYEGGKKGKSSGSGRSHSCAREIGKMEGCRVKIGPYRGHGDYEGCPVCGQVYEIF